MHLEKLPDFSALHLCRTRVTDTGLMHLKGLTNLRIVDLRGTNVTNAGAKELKRALPRLTIMR